MATDTLASPAMPDYEGWPEEDTAPVFASPGESVFERYGREAEIIRDYFNEVDPEAPERPRLSGAMHWCYWRIFNHPHSNDPRKGWISIGPAIGGRQGSDKVSEYRRNMIGESLDQYGTWSTYIRDENYLNPYVVDDNANFQRMPFGRFTQLIKAGGIKEFPVSQIRALRWHHNPLVRRLRPDATRDPDFLCEFCPGENKTFPNKGDYMSHIQALHETQFAQVQTAQANRELLENLARQMQGQNSIESVIELLKAVGVTANPGIRVDAPTQAETATEEDDFDTDAALAALDEQDSAVPPSTYAEIGSAAPVRRGRPPRNME